MGQAKNRGTFEVRRNRAIAVGRGEGCRTLSAAVEKCIHGMNRAGEDEKGWDDSPWTCEDEKSYKDCGGESCDRCHLRF